MSLLLNILILKSVSKVLNNQLLKQNYIYEIQCLKLINAYYLETLIGISTKTIGAYALNFRSMSIFNRNKIVFP